MSTKNTTPSYTEIYAWGNDSNGQIGVSNTSGKKYTIPRFCSFNVVITSLSCGLAHSAFVAANGFIYTMGSNEDGRLGVGSNEINNSFSPCLVESLSRFKALQISCGARHTAALLDNGEVFLWGYGADGQLGNEELISYNLPQHLDLSHIKTSLKSVFIKAISCGDSHSMIITEEGIICGFGSSTYGQLGTGLRKMEKLPVILICFTERIRNVSCGSKHTLFLTDNKKVFACGDNSQGQLGTGNKKNSYLPIKLTFFENMLVQKICARDFSAILTESGEFFVCGDVSQSSNYLPEKMEVPSNNKIEDLDIGFGFGVCLDYDGNVYSWGNNKNGELGLGDYENKEKFNNIVSLNGRRIKGIHCGANYVMVLGNTISPGENHFFNSSRLDGFDGIKENNLLRNRTYNENESISKRNRQYLKSYDNGINNNPNNNTKNNCLNIYTNETNEISTYKNNATLDKNINSDTKNSRLGKSLTPIRHLTSEEIKSRQKVSIFHNVNSQKPTNINEPEVVELSENQRSAETDIIEENYMINTIDAQKIKNLIKHNENIIKETEITQNQIISNKYNKNNTKDEEKLMPNVIISNDTNFKKYDKYSKYSSFHEKSNFSIDSKAKISSVFNENSRFHTTRHNINKEKIEIEKQFGVSIEQNDISMKEYNFLKSQMKDLVDKIAIFEADQKEIEKIKIEQNHLKLNYNKLEEKYLLLEQNFKAECLKNDGFTKELTVERKKTAEQNDKILNLNEKLAEREQDIKYLKTETMKCQNYFDENLKIIKEKEQTQSAKYNDTIQQLSEGLKNFEDENKFLENALQNKDSLLEKLKKESEEHYKNLKKFESDNSKQDETINQLMISLNEKEQMFIQEKNNFFEETKNLKKMLEEKENKIQNLYKDGKKSMDEKEFRCKQEKNELVHQLNELDKKNSDKQIENEYLSNELKQEQYKNKQLEGEFNKLKNLLQEKNNFNFQTNSSTYEIPSNKIINESNIPEFETSTNYISNNYKTSPHFKQSNKENINKKVLIDSIEVLEKNSYLMNNKQKNYNNQRNHEEILLNNEYFDKNQKKETQKQLNLRNSNKTRNLEKSYPFSRELKIKKGEDDIFIGQNDKNGEENSNNTSGVFNSNFIEIKSKLSNLQKNKVFLEKRMMDFEKKLKESKEEANNN